MKASSSTLFHGFLGTESRAGNATRKLVLGTRFPLLIASLFAVVLLSGSARAGDDAPLWLKQAAASTVPAYNKDVPGVVLHGESRVTVDEDGRVVRSTYYAVKILTREGRGLARAEESYTTDNSKVREMRAWLIRPSGEVKKLSKDELLDVAQVDNDVYNEARMMVINARKDAEPGAVFGYEAVTEERSMFNQIVWEFQERLPVRLSRFSAAFPAGWRADTVTFNHGNVEPQVNGTTYVWELHDLPPIDAEIASPPVTSLAPRLCVSYFPRANPKPGVGRTFANWAEVSRWMAELSDGQAALDEKLSNRAKQLVEGAKSELDRIQAIGRYVQAINYVSIQIGVGRFRPHTAIEVFAKSYGDCKDKANLMRAMLQAVGIGSHLVLIYSGDPSFVREEWPSPQQFNHCIVAVKVSDATAAPTIITHPGLGRLLIFDPTDDNTPVGDLPGHEQESFALIVSRENGALLRMPSTPPEANLLKRQADVVLAPDGSISANVHEWTAGQSAVAQRRGFRELGRAEYVKMIEGWITKGANGARVSKVEPSDQIAEGRFALDVNFTADGYGQLMQGRLLVFKPAIVSRRESVFLTGSDRKHPVVLRPYAYDETVTVKLPAGFDVDELPDPVKLEAAFGSYATSYIVKDGQLYFKRTLVVRRATIPVADYSKVRSFYERIRTAEQSPVVLVRK